MDGPTAGEVGLITTNLLDFVLHLSLIQRLEARTALPHRRACSATAAAAHRTGVTHTWYLR
eukprot:6179534-Pleurochrysis_carterae.AAC.5